LARGWNGYGAINGGSTASFNQKDSKLTTLDINVVQAAAGNNYSLYLKSDGTLWGMGANWSGNLGGNAPINGFNYITQVGSNIKSIFTNQGHSLYITNDNILWGVGSNSNGQLGNGTSDSRVNRATQIATNVSTASAGGSHTLFLKSDGTLWATGNNNDGQIGDGSTTQRNTPVLVASDVRSISAGLNTSFFIKTDGSLWGCGKNTEGQLGDGTKIRKLIPTKVATNVNSVSSGYDHTLFVKSDGTLWGMGYNQFSQLGDGTLTSKTNPVQLATNVIFAAAGNQQSFFIKTDQSIGAMGYNSYGELLDGTTTERTTPIYLSKPAFLTQPITQSVASGASFTVTGTANGTGTLSYQWFKDGSAITGATTTTYSIASTTAASAGNYALVATNWLGSTTSTVAALTVISPVSITTQPTAQTVIVGNTATFSVVATGSAPLTYQWSKDGVAISGATAASYALAATTAANAGSYTVLITNSVGSVTSAPATLTVNPAGVAPSITTQPISQSVTAGKSVTLSVVAAGTSPLTYQWRKDGAAITGATSASLTFSSAAASDTGSYSVVIANSLGSINSDVAVLTVNTPPTITVQPSSQTVVAGAPITLSVTATGPGR
jgi:alpha-tubulin suppressor-like RCC1 family protein